MAEAHSWDKKRPRHIFGLEAWISCALATGIFFATAWTWFVGTGCMFPSTGVSGGVAGNDYFIGKGTALVMLLPGLLPLMGSSMRARGSSYPYLKSRLMPSLLVGFAHAAFMYWPLSAIYLAWMLVTDVFSILPLCPPGRVAQILVEEATSGRLIEALATTYSRNLIAIALGFILALFFATILQESDRARSLAGPVLKAAGFLPPTILFTYTPAFGSLVFAEEVRTALENGGLDPSSSLFRVMGHYDRILIMTLFAFWPLLAASIAGYNRVAGDLSIEIQSLRLSRLAAVWKIKAPYAVRFMSPSFTVAVALVFVVCVESESIGSLGKPSDGIGAHYLRSGVENGAVDITLFAMFTLGAFGMILLAVLESLNSYFSGDRPAS